MYCTNPNYFTGVGFTPCGKCTACRINKKKEWSDRIQIESLSHPYNYFITLTYSPENYPVDESLHKEDLKLFFKRLGYYCGKVPQFFAVGEYGDTTERAHYHCALFCDKDEFENIRKAWTLGRVGIDSLTTGRCRYIAGYCVKKLTKSDDIRLNGRSPEFFMSSRRPALGYQMLFDMLYRMSTDVSFKKIMLSHIFPPSSIKLGGKYIRLPRYIRDKLKPLYECNYDEQQAFIAQKRAKDRIILEKITETLSQLCLEYGIEDSKENRVFILKKKLAERDAMNKKAYNIKQRKIL